MRKRFLGRLRRSFEALQSGPAEAPAADPQPGLPEPSPDRAALEVDLQEARAARAKLRSDLDELMKTHLQQSRLLERNQRTTRRLEEQLAQWRDRARAVEGELAASQSEAVGHLRRVQELEPIVAQRKELESAYDALDRERSELAAQVAQLTQHRSSLQAERDRLSAQTAELHAALAAKEAEVAAGQVARDRLKAQVASLLNELSERAAATAQLEADLERLHGIEAEHARLSLEHDAVSARCEVALAQLAETEQAVQVAEATIKAAQRLSASLEWRSALDSVLDAALELVRFDRGTLALVDELQADLKIEVARNSPIAISEMSRFKLGEGIAGWALSQRQPVLVRDSRSDPHFKVSDPSHQPGSFIAVPLVAGTEALGVLTLTRAANDPFSDQDLRSLVGIGTKAADALTNARLVNVLRERQQDMSALVAKTKDLWAATDAGQLLVSVLKSARELAGGRAALIALRDPRGQGLVVAGSLDIPAQVVEERTAWGAAAAIDVLRTGKPWVCPMQEILPPALQPVVEAAGMRLLISLPCRTGATELEIVDGFISRPAPSAAVEPSDEVAGVLNIYRDTTEPISARMLEQLTIFADQASAAIRTARRWERIKNQLQMTASFNARLLGRERYIQQLQYRIRQLEKELGRYKAA